MKRKYTNFQKNVLETFTDSYNRAYRYIKKGLYDLAKQELLTIRKYRTIFKFYDCL